MVSLTISRRLRSTPFSKRLESLGLQSYTVYNHTLLPTVIRDLEEDYHHLKQKVQVWDVSCQKQIQVKGQDAFKLMQLITPRDLSKMQINQCCYIPVVNERGGMLNDPVAIKHSQDDYWVSIADSDLLLWIQGIATALELNVEVAELNIYPLAVQGPMADALMTQVFGDGIANIKFFRAGYFDFAHHALLISRSGYSKQGGFEIYVQHPENVDHYAEQLWDALFEQGKEFDVRPGGPNYIERIESGLLSYGNDMTIKNNPYECGLGHFCHDHRLDYCIGGKALKKISQSAQKKCMYSLSIAGEPLRSCRESWDILYDNQAVGQVTSAIWSPDFHTNVALGMIDQQLCRIS